MRKVLLSLTFVLAASFCAAQTMTLDEAVKTASDEMSARLPRGSTLAVVNFRSESTRLSDYVIDELANKERLPKDT